MNIKIFGNLFFKTDSQMKLLDHIIICIYDLLQKHIMTLIKINENQTNIYNEIKSLIFQAVDKRYLNFANPSYAMKNTICDCLSILIISGITHSWEKCIEELISKANSYSQNGKVELIYICLRSIADCDLIYNLIKNDDEKDDWSNFSESQRDIKAEIKDKLISKSEIVFNFVKEIYKNINIFEDNLKFRIIKSIIDLIIFWTQLNINILTNNDISTLVMEIISQSININNDEQIDLSIEIIKTVAESLNEFIHSSSNCKIYEFYGKIDESDSPENVINSIYENINIEEKKGAEKWLDFILKLLEQYVYVKNKNEIIVWALAKMFCSIIENYIFLFLDLNNPRNKAVFKWLKIFISEKRKISFIFFDTLSNMMIFITDYFRFYTYDETQKKNFAEYLMDLLLSIMENCSYKFLKENDYSKLQNEILFQYQELNWNTSYTNNYISGGEDNFQLDDIDINDYRNNAEDAIYYIYYIFKSGFDSNIYEIELLKKIVNLLNIDNSVGENDQSELNKNAIKLDVILFTLKIMVKNLNDESNPATFDLINEYIYHLQNSIYINNLQIFIDYLLIVNQFSKYAFNYENNFQNIIAKLLSVTKLNNNQILTDSCYIILANLCSNFKSNIIYKNYFELFLKRYKILCANYSLNNISSLESFIRILFYSLGIKNENDNDYNENENNNNKLNHNNELISCINEIIEPLLFKRKLEKETDKLKIKNDIIKSYILYKEIFGHFSFCEENLRKYLINCFISNSINELININENSQSPNSDIKIFKLFPDDIEIFNSIIDFYSSKSNYLAEACQNIFKEINITFINLLKSNRNFFKVICFFGYFYKDTLNNLKETDNNYNEINKYILESLLFIIKIAINYITTEKNSTEETLDKISFILIDIIDVLPKIYIPESNINIFTDIISIINFILNLVDSITTSKKEKICDKLISNIIKSITSILNNNILKIISKYLQQNQRKELVETIFDKTYKLLNLSEFQFLSFQDLPHLYYQIIYFDINLFNQAFALLLNSTGKFNENDINNVIKYIQTFYTNKNKIIELIEDTMSIILGKKQTDCLEFYYNQLKTKKL